MIRTKAVSIATLGALGMAIAATGTASAQDQPASSTSVLNLPTNPTVFGTSLPSVVKATAIINGEIITQTDIDQRLALLAIANDGEIPATELERLRLQVLRNLIDESLQIQAAKAAEIKVDEGDVDRTVKRVAGNVKQTPEQMAGYLQARGSSIRSIRRQILGEISWRRLQSAKIESGISVGDDEVKAVIERMEASKGTQEYRVGEIFLAATSANAAQAMTNANQIVDALRKGGSFVAYARQYSEASTAAVGGDLGWVRPEQLPDSIAEAVRTLQTGQLSSPIAVPGGVSIVAVQDTRKVLTADPRAAELNLKQVSVNFPAGTSKAQAEPIVARFAAAALNVGGCGGADKLAADFNAEVVQSEGVKLKDLPGALQEMMLPMQVGQATRPFGSLTEGVRVLVICGRDEVNPSMPTYETVMAQMNEERINMRARRYLRDLRRDAIIDFR
ncbi:MAG: peptidylprolyl isomerase [Sphingomonas bacterium]|nr:peptidylprolyl isomerase [Sphingomonas bacterium]